MIAKSWFGRTALAGLLSSLLAVPLLVAASVPALAQGPIQSRTLTGLNGPTTLAIAPNGDQYVANQQSQNVVVYDAGSTTPNPQKTITSTSFQVVESVALDANGNLYVSDLQGQAVYVFAANTFGDLTPTRTIAIGEGATGLAFDSGGNLYVTALVDSVFTTGSKVFFVPNGASAPNLAKTLTGVVGPAGIAIASSGAIYVGQLGIFNNGIDWTGTTVMVFDPGATTPNPAKTLTGLDAPGGIAIRSDGTVYVANHGNHNTGTTVSVFDPGATTPNSKETLTGVYSPGFANRDASGYLYVPNNLLPGTSNPGTTVSVFDTRQPQKSKSGCVKQKGGISLGGSKTLMAPACRTNSGQRVAVRVQAKQLRGDVNLFRLYCASGGKVLRTTAAGSRYGAGYRYCKRGSLRIRTAALPLRLRIEWYAPTVRDFLPYRLVHTYRT